MLRGSVVKNRCRFSSTRTSTSTLNRQMVNGPVIKVLQENMEKENDRPTRNAYKIRAFRYAINTIDALETPIKSAADVKDLKGIGPGIIRRIEAYLAGKTYEEPEVDDESKLAEKRRRAVVSELQSVPGIGRSKALQLFDSGCMSIADLREAKYTALLTASQKVGLSYLEHLAKPVSRIEAETVLAFMRDNLSTKFEANLVGSYRRGRPTSGDIDIILFHPSHVHIPFPTILPPENHADSLNASSTTAESNKRGRSALAFRKGYTSVAERENSLFFASIITPLKERGLIVAAFVEGERRWRGIVRVPERVADSGYWESRSERLRKASLGEGAFRSLDITLVPFKSRGAAYLALTGDTDFNRSTRMRAAQMGMHLNEFGLWRWRENTPVNSTHSPDDPSWAEEAPKVSKTSGYWELVAAESEREILDEIGLDWVEPERRNFEFLNEKKTPRTSEKGRGRGRPRKIPSS